MRRQDDAFVAAFSARGTTEEGIIEAAKENYRELLIHNFGCWEARRLRKTAALKP